MAYSHLKIISMKVIIFLCLDKYVITNKSIKNTSFSESNILNYNRLQLIKFKNFVSKRKNGSNIEVFDSDVISKTIKNISYKIFKINVSLCERFFPNLKKR